MDIGYPAAVGVALGVTDVMTKLGRFPAQITFSGQYLLSFDLSTEFIVKYRSQY